MFVIVCGNAANETFIPTQDFAILWKIQSSYVVIVTTVLSIST